MKAFIRKHLHVAVNLFLVVTLGSGALYRAEQAWTASKFDLVEALFFANNLLMVVVILVRRQHRAIDRNVFHQGVALVAFFSGIAFDARPVPAGPLFAHLSLGVTVAALGLGAVTLLNLGRSFGILVAARAIKTGGLYRVIRHPMYFTDILWRVGLILGNLSVYNAALFAVSTAAYVYRAVLEERFLGQFPEYREYRERVKYRFVPGVF